MSAILINRTSLLYQCSFTNSVLYQLGLKLTAFYLVPFRIISAKNCSTNQLGRLIRKEQTCTITKFNYSLNRLIAAGLIYKSMIGQRIFLNLTEQGKSFAVRFNKQVIAMMQADI